MLKLQKIFPAEVDPRPKDVEKWDY